MGLRARGEGQRSADAARDRTIGIVPFGRALPQQYYPVLPVDAARGADARTPSHTMPHNGTRGSSCSIPVPKE